MLKNYFKIAWRNIIKHRFYSFVNIAGLFTGIAFTSLIGAYVWQEMQVNKQLKNAKQQYFLQSEWKGVAYNNGLTTLAPVARRLKEEYPHLVAEYYRWDGITSGVTKGDKSFREGIQLGDSTLLSMYGFELLHGSATTALKAPYSAVIKEETAVKYFGRKDVVGEQITIQSFSGSKRDFTITGVLKTPFRNSVTNINDDNNNTVFIPANTYEFFGRVSMEDWSNTWIPSYIELSEGASVSNVQKAIQQLINAHAPEGIKANLKVRAVPLREYYLQKDNGLVKRMLYTLSLVALFILLMAVVNFINIAISSSTGRMKEIGLRKVLGGMRGQLIVQFLAESFILVLIATLLALVSYPILAPVFSGIVGKQIPMLGSFPFYFITIPFLLILVVSILAGLYPAFVLSSINTINSLKGKLKTVKENVLLRKSLVGFQFAIALVVLIAAAIVTQQVSLFFSKSIGYNRDYVVSSQVPRDWSPAGVNKMLTVRNEFASMPEVSSVTLSYEIPNGNNGSDAQVYNYGADSTKAVSTQLLATDENYLRTYQIPLSSGVFFGSEGLDSGKVIINETAANVFGFKSAADAVGKQLRIQGDPTVFTVKGVVKDFHFFSMQSAMPPILFFNVRTTVAHRFLSFKLKPGNVSVSIAAIEKKWAQLLPGSSFEYTFMDDSLKKMYTSELQLKKATYTATLLSLIIVLLGVLGLVSLSIHKRVKEIGIRKVLGASFQSIVSLFVTEFIGVILLSAVIACPLAYLLMNEWLANYFYRIQITPAPFIWAVGGLGFIALLLIVIQTLKAAQMNPAKSLKTE